MQTTKKQPFLLCNRDVVIDRDSPNGFRIVEGVKTEFSRMGKLYIVKFKDGTSKEMFQNETMEVAHGGLSNNRIHGSQRDSGRSNCKDSILPIRT